MSAPPPSKPPTTWAARFPGRARAWQLPTTRLTFGVRPLVMGILNVTPDSFSDGGLHVEPRAAIDHALRLVADGADILDVGGESTRPTARRSRCAKNCRE